MDFETHDYDVLVIGAGGAGLRAAIEASAAGVKVGLICKSLLGKAHTVMAEGGVAAALGNVEAKDNWKVHFKDTRKGAPLLELVDAIGRFHRVDLRHAPLVEGAAALHRVFEGALPVVFRLDVAERSSDAAFGHDRVRLAEERLADEADRNAHRACFDRRAKTRAAGADHEDVVRMGLVLGVRHLSGSHRKRMS